MKFSTNLLIMYSFVSSFTRTHTSVLIDETLPQTESGNPIFSQTEVDSMKITYPALILSGLIPFLQTPAIPNRCENGIYQFDYMLLQTITDRLHISYACQADGKLKIRSKPTCPRPLERQMYQLFDQSCKKAGGEKYLIGYHGKDTNKCISLYESCYDVKHNRVIYTKHQMGPDNLLYCHPCYSKDNLEIIYQAEKTFRTGVEKDLLTKDLAKENDKLKAEGKPHLEAFQLVPIEDMILYNQKTLTADLMNYSLIWSNIARYSWNRVTKAIRRLMMNSKSDLDVYTGVYEHKNRDYPLYLWKIIRDSFLKRSIVVVVHNQPPDDKFSYDHLCQESLCQVYGLNVDENNISRGITYCCKMSYFTRNISFLEGKFTEFTPLDIIAIQGEHVRVPLGDKLQKNCESTYGHDDETDQKPQPSNLLEPTTDTDTIEDTDSLAEDPTNIAQASSQLTPSMEKKLQMVEDRLETYHMFTPKSRFSSSPTPSEDIIPVQDPNSQDTPINSHIGLELSPSMQERKRLLEERLKLFQNTSFKYQNTSFKSHDSSIHTVDEESD